MAMCEKCMKNGYSATDMFIEADVFLGPCCKSPNAVQVKLLPQQPAPAPVRLLEQPKKDPNDVEYGIEVSNKVGVHAWVNYQGLQLSFERTPEQIQKFLDEQNIHVS